MLEKIIKEIRNYEGVTRKNPICTLTNCFQDIDNFGKTIISFGDDSAVLKSNGNYMLFAADGIWSKLIENDPVWAGYCAVLANVNDIYAMGGRPLALTNVMSSKDTAKCPEVVEGIAQGCKKFKVPMVGGHLHPNTTVLSLSISIVGEAKKLLTSFDAIPEQDILLAIDITGEQHKTFLNWDSTSMKTSDIVIGHLERMAEIAERGLATAAKDVSNPGILGTIGMLLETSDVGATIDIDAIPRPETVDLIDWLKMYPGFGFVITCAKENSKEIQSIFKEENITCEIIGSINEGSNMILKMGNEKKILFDFSKDIITGITKESLPK